MTRSDRQRKDVLIGGGGFAGLALGIALRQALGENFAVTIADPAFARGHMADTRASAIAAAARRLFQTIGVWEQVADEAQPILDMVVTDSRLEDAVRPAFLSFGGEVAQDEPFAHMIENGPLMCALMEKAQETGVDLRAARVTDFSVPSSSSHHIEVALSDRRDCFSAPAGWRRRSTLGDPRARRHHHPWMGLWTIRYRHDGGA